MLAEKLRSENKLSDKEYQSLETLCLAFPDPSDGDLEDLYGIFKQSTNPDIEKLLGTIMMKAKNIYLKLYVSACLIDLVLGKKSCSPEPEHLDYFEVAINYCRKKLEYCYCSKLCEYCQKVLCNLYQNDRYKTRGEAEEVLTKLKSFSSSAAS